MAVYTASPFIGPVLGPMISGFINQVRMFSSQDPDPKFIIRLQNTSWRWTFRILIIWTFVVTAALIAVSILSYNGGELPDQ